MRRIVQRMLEQTSNVAAVVADGQPARPRGVACGEGGESSCLLVERADDCGRLLLGVALGGCFDEVGFDRREVRLVFGERLLDSERVEGGDVATVRRLLD